MEPQIIHFITETESNPTNGWGWLEAKWAISRLGRHDRMTRKGQIKHTFISSQNKWWKNKCLGLKEEPAGIEAISKHTVNKTEKKRRQIQSGWSYWNLRGALRISIWDIDDWQIHCTLLKPCANHSTKGYHESSETSTKRKCTPTVCNTHNLLWYAGHS